MGFAYIKLESAIFFSAYNIVFDVLVRCLQMFFLYNGVYLLLIITCSQPQSDKTHRLQELQEVNMWFWVEVSNSLLYYLLSVTVVISFNLIGLQEQGKNQDHVLTNIVVNMYNTVYVQTACLKKNALEAFEIRKHYLVDLYMLIPTLSNR